MICLRYKIHKKVIFTTALKTGAQVFIKADCLPVFLAFNLVHISANGVPSKQF